MIFGGFMSTHAHGSRSSVEPAAAGRHRSRLVWALALTTGFLVLEGAGSLWTGSLVLLADAGHMLTDVAGLAMSLVVVWFAQKPPTPANTYGYFRTEILASLANGVVLFLMAGYILYEAFQRIWRPTEVVAGPMLVIAVLGLGVNLLGMTLLHRGAGESLNLPGAYLGVLSDALGSLGVILAAVIIQTTGVTLADPLIGAAIGFFILPWTWGLMRQAVHSLMEGVPPHLDVREIEAAMTTVHGVLTVPDLHVWTLTSRKKAMSGHVIEANLAAGPGRARCKGGPRQDDGGDQTNGELALHHGLLSHSHSLGSIRSLGTLR
jgi:cobalt-zinc-cadmium efflux system protein